jgi:glucose-6-phosphate 1-dehydrogenase
MVMIKSENHILVIFGASGDLTGRKLIPALYKLFRQKLMPDRFAIIGLGRTPLNDDSFRDEMKKALINFTADKTPDENFLKSLHYFSFNYEALEDYARLKNTLSALNGNSVFGQNLIFYLATPPALYSVIPENLSRTGLNLPGYRVIIEKPFGTSLDSAKSLNRQLLASFNEDQVYRIDHYLGKETVQNILVTRFSNNIFEPLWNRNYVHHVEITSSESLGVENRGGYYDSSGALRDMVQNHLLQLVGLIAMEPPVMADSTSIRNETVKVFQSLRPLSEKAIHTDVIRGQYTESSYKGENYPGYRQEKGVGPASKTETYAAIKFYIDNWRWNGIPFYIRTGKRLPTRVTEVVIHFKPTPQHLFCSPDGQPGESNQLIIRIQPDEGILLKFGMKIPGAGFKVQNVNMDFHYSSLADNHLPEAYERLLLDCMLNDSTLYARGDAVELSWKFIDPILKAWKDQPDIPLYGYPSGTWGPDVADNLIEEPWLTWRYPCKNLSNDGIYCEL